MINRCDSVDALMYAYYEFMKIKEENKMLEKNKDYIEFSMWSYMATHKPGQCTDINITGISPEPGVLCTNNPFDIPCDVVVVPKRAFDRLQADNEHYRELAKQREENYNLLLKKTGFDTVESLVFYLTNIGKHDTLLEVLASLRDQVKYACDEWKDMKKKLEECEKDYISERDKAETLDKENEELKKKLAVPDPFAEHKELFKELYSIEDTEALEWALNHTAGGQDSVNGWRASSQFWNGRYKDLLKLVGFSSKKEVKDYLINEAECDTLYEAVSKLKDQVKYTCAEWYSANSSNNSWKAAAECNSPKELIEKIKGFKDEIGIYSRALKDWKEETGCPSPSAAKTMIESQASWCHAYNDVKEKNEKLGEIIKSWKNVTGYSNPEVYMQARISGTFNTPFDYTAAWQKATGYDSPKNFLKWKTNIEGIMEAWKSGTGCKYPAEARILLEKWKALTKCETPEAAKQYIDRLKGRLNKIHGYSVDW